MKKIKLLPIICVIVLCFGLLAGCSSSNDSSSNETTEVETEEVEVTTEEITAEDYTIDPTVTWPSGDLADRIPVPALENMTITESSEGGYLYVKGYSSDDDYFNVYADECSNIGFDYWYYIDTEDDDNWCYEAKDEEGYYLVVNYYPDDKEFDVDFLAPAKDTEE